MLISKDRSPYILTKKIHHSQEIIKQYKNGKVLIRLSLILNKELNALVLGFGNDIEVRRPKVLRDEISALLKMALYYY